MFRIGVHGLERYAGRQDEMQEIGYEDTGVIIFPASLAYCS